MIYSLLSARSHDACPYRSILRRIDSFPRVLREDSWDDEATVQRSGFGSSRGGDARRSQLCLPGSFQDGLASLQFRGRLYPTFFHKVARVVAEEGGVDLGPPQPASLQSPPRVRIVVDVSVPKLVRLCCPAQYTADDVVCVPFG